MFRVYCAQKAVEAVADMRKLKVKRHPAFFAVNGAKK